MLGTRDFETSGPGQSLGFALSNFAVHHDPEQPSFAISVSAGIAMASTTGTAIRCTCSRTAPDGKETLVDPLAWARSAILGCKAAGR
ncbi:hypothetical protein SCP_0411000 [Sparassis crispa]|uniref:Uncharacterized protein n=1 Tax=Sparassis crispa TaxID=139825 RepID=A0A401GKL9_9APHY|nr:hypothetical protein SCP_0411000 [Sparassis crispa]GBE82715.1 hypothetical protein SCP_0411000 [Sparassis crispa]